MAEFIIEEKVLSPSIFWVVLNSYLIFKTNQLLPLCLENEQIPQSITLLVKSNKIIIITNVI